MQNGSADQKMHEMQEEQLLDLHFPLGNVHCLLLPGRSVAKQLKIKKNENRNDKYLLSTGLSTAVRGY